MFFVICKVWLKIRISYNFLSWKIIHFAKNGEKYSSSMERLIQNSVFVELVMLKNYQFCNKQFSISIDSLIEKIFFIELANRKHIAG